MCLTDHLTQNQGLIDASSLYCYYNCYYYWYFKQYDQGGIEDKEILNIRAAFISH